MKCLLKKSLLLFSFVGIMTATTFAAGLENFDNYTETGSSYKNGVFVGQDGSDWSYTQCRGDIEINAPTPCIGKGRTPTAKINSGSIHDGCGNLSLDWKKAFSTDVNLDVKINGNVVATITGGTEGSFSSFGPIVVNVAGIFTISFEQKDSNSGQVAIDNIIWTSYSGGVTPSSTNKPTIESIAHSVTPTNNQSVKIFVSAFDNFATLQNVNIIYSDNDWSSSSSSTAASLVEGKVFSAVLPTFSAGKTIQYTASAKNSLTNYGYASTTNEFTVRQSDISGSNFTIRIMAANTTSGNQQSYESPGIRIFQGLKPDIVGIQEFDYESGNLRDLVDIAFGDNFFYYCEEGGEQIPNGVISRWPFKASGEWNDSEVSNRDFAWATIDIPGSKDLHIVSVHLLTSGSGVRNDEAKAIKTQILANFPADDYIVVAGDMNTGSRSESCINTFKSIPLSDSHIPEDQDGDDGTNASRSKPYDWVLPNIPLNNCHTATIIDGHSFADGLVYDSRITSPYQLLPSPIQSGDSGASSMQHMAVVKDYLIPSGDGTTTNFAPNLNYINNISVQIDSSLNFSITATDADNDIISLTCSVASNFSSVPSSGTVTGTFSWTPSEEDYGNHAIIFTADSGELYARQMINISVVPEPMGFLIFNFGFWICVIIRKISN